MSGEGFVVRKLNRVPPQEKFRGSTARASPLQSLLYRPSSTSADEDPNHDFTPKQPDLRRFLPYFRKVMLSLFTFSQIIFGAPLPFVSSIFPGDNIAKALSQTSFPSSLLVNSNREETVVTGGMRCVSSKCQREFSACLASPICATGLRCFVTCAISDSTAAVKVAPMSKVTSMRTEGVCQERCMDLHQNPLLDDFTECALTRNKCYPALEADVRYPPLRTNDLALLWQKDLWVSGTYESFLGKLKELFQGTWYIAAGLNPAFDSFDCQIHEFFEPKNDKLQGINGAIVADATFSYRVKLDNQAVDSLGRNWFVKTGEKRIMLLPQPKDSLTKKTFGLHFDPNKRWGVDSFLSDVPQSVEHLRQQNIPLSPRASSPPRLVLTLRPSMLDYEDDWVVLSSSQGPDGYIVLIYRGKNSAWDGYGGLNIYTRTGKLPSSNDQLAGIKDGLQKVGLQLEKDLIIVDNSCPVT